MIELLILAVLAIAALTVTCVVQAVYHQRHINRLLWEHEAERTAWQGERRFLIDRAIAQHINEVIALEREDTRKKLSDYADVTQPRAERPLIEGLS